MTFLQQELQKIARSLAAEYPSERVEWERAANNLRQPYWGWDQADTTVPPREVIELTNVEILLVRNGQVVREPVPNPFLSFTFPSGASLPRDFSHGNLSSLEKTARHPTREGNTDVASLRV